MQTILSNIIRDLVSISEAAVFLGVSTYTLRRWSEKGRIRAIRPDGIDRYFLREDLQKLKENNTYTISEAAAFLHLSPSTLRRIEKRGILLAKRNDQGERMYTRQELEKFRKSQK